MIDKYTSRKFWSMMFWQAVFTVMVFVNVITGDQYSNLTLITLGAYFAANVASKFAQKSSASDTGNIKPLE